MQGAGVTSRGAAIDLILIQDDHALPLACQIQRGCTADEACSDHRDIKVWVHGFRSPERSWATCPRGLNRRTEAKRWHCQLLRPDTTPQSLRRLWATTASASALPG